MIIDVVGQPMLRPPVIKDGLVVEEAVFEDRWLLNVMGSLGKTLRKHQVHPKQPMRAWNINKDAKITYLSFDTQEEMLEAVDTIEALVAEPEEVKPRFGLRAAVAKILKRLRGEVDAD